MAGRQNFKVRKGLDVTDSATIGGGLIASGLQYPLSDGSSNEVIKTDGSGTLTFGKLSISDLSDVNLASLIDNSILVYDDATQKYVAQNTVDEFTLDGGTF